MYKKKWIQEIISIGGYFNFIANNDARGNIRFWRSGLLDNKFRWIVYDTDPGFDLGDHRNNMIQNLPLYDTLVQSPGNLS